MTESTDRADEPRSGDTAGQLPWRALPMSRYAGALIQHALRLWVMRASAQLRNVVQNGEKVFARARLEYVRVTERYSYSQVISQNPAGGPAKSPEGRIELALPLDGDEYFSRRAYSDVTRARQSNAASPAAALVGYLSFTDYDGTDLDSVLGLGDTYGSFPIRMPLESVPGPGEADSLIADDRTWMRSYDYRPDSRRLSVTPVHVEAQLDDLDTAEFSPEMVEEIFDRVSDAARAAEADRAMQAEQASREQQATQIMKVMQTVHFRPELVLRMTVLLHVPRALAENAKAEVSKVSLEWPTHTSLHALSLAMDGNPHTLRYNPTLKRLEWSEVPMIPEEAEGEICTFRSSQMTLSIPQPGELYRCDKLTGWAEVKLDRLLSGMDTRLFDATGRLCRVPLPQLETVVSAEFSLILGDAFSSRELLPSQQLHFDEVIPNKMRINDIKTALANQNFKVKELWPGAGEENVWLSAWRTEGADKLRLVLYIEGRHHKARRRRRVPGGVTYRTNLDSGELRIYAYGSQPKDCKVVVREMNALRRALRQRFSRLPARR